MLDSAIQTISFEASFSVPNLRSKLNQIHWPAAQVTEHDSNSTQPDAVQLQGRTDSDMVWERWLGGRTLTYHIYHLPLSCEEALFHVVPRGWSEVTALWVKGSSAELPLMLQKTSWLLGPSAATLADATNLISVSVFCWGLQHKPWKVTEEWQLKKFIFEPSTHLEFISMKQNYFCGSRTLLQASTFSTHCRQPSFWEPDFKLES